MTTINFSYVRVEKARVEGDGVLTIRLTGERGKPSEEIKDRIDIVIHRCCGIHAIVREVMLAHDRELRRVEHNRDWEEGQIRRELRDREVDDE